MKITKKSDIIPLINEQGLPVAQVAKVTKRSEPTIWRWVKELREAGFEVKTGKPGPRRMPL